MDFFSPADSSERLHTLQPYTLAVLPAGLLLWCIGQAFYNLFLHPLRSYPGPLLWHMSGLFVDYHLIRGTFTARTVAIHEKYVPVVRLGPNELSYADGRVWKDVWDHRPEFPKDMRTSPPPNGVVSIIAAEKTNHARYRRLLAHAFSEKGLREQHERIQEYVNLLIDRLRERAGNGQTTDLVEWYTMTAFDVIGDLAWGEAFHSLRDRRVHEWIPAILDNVKFMFQNSVFLRRVRSVTVSTKICS